MEGGEGVINGDGIAEQRTAKDADLTGLYQQPPVDFALRVLQRVGISRTYYDTYVELDTAAGGLFVAFGLQAVTSAALRSTVGDSDRFENLHRSSTGRSAIPGAKPFPGLTAAVRTGRAKHLPIDLSGLAEIERTVLGAVRGIPAGQLRPTSWILREAGLPVDTDAAVVVHALAVNPVSILIPCHRVTSDDGTPFDVGHRTGTSLREAEGIDMRPVAELAGDGMLFLGSDTTHIYCHPTCANARRITPAHRKPFRSARDARQAGYRPCKSCRPAPV